MNRKILILSSASSSLLLLLIMASVAQASLEPPATSRPGIGTTLETAILNPASREENPLSRHIGCRCALCAGSFPLSSFSSLDR
jgi:hypothetical protein